MKELGNQYVCVRMDLPRKQKLGFHYGVHRARISRHLPG